MHESRVGEYTDDAVKARFLPGGRINTLEVMSFPTLFMEEGIGDEVARVGWLNRIEQIGREYHHHHMFDPDIPALTNSEIWDLAAELGIHEWEFSRNHWSIKNADLNYVLLKRTGQRKPRPTVFHLSENPVRPDLIALMMPFHGGFDRVQGAVVDSANALGLECQRADSFWQHAHIMQDIVELICTASVVICDLSGKNPNVFYEAGIAHALGKEVILITQSMDDVPFDLQALRCITYLNNNEGCDRLSEEVTARLTTLLAI